jgi:hypothetical protein
MAAQHRNADARTARVPPLASNRLTAGRCRSGRPASSWVIRASSDRRPSPAGLAAASAGLAGMAASFSSAAASTPRPADPAAARSAASS